MQSLVSRVLNAPYYKPEFKINSLDMQNNDPLKNDHTDSTRNFGATDYKPIPAATFSGSIKPIPQAEILEKPRPSMEMIERVNRVRDPLAGERRMYRPPMQSIRDMIKESKQIKYK
jgi:hypothetical protein